MKTPTTIKLQQLIFGAFDQKTSIIWLIGPLGVNSNGFDDIQSYRWDIQIIHHNFYLLC
jgi:hypothetical protein